MTRLRLVVAPAMGFLAVACGSSGNGGGPLDPTGSEADVLTASHLADQVEAVLEERVGVRPHVRCPEDLMPEPGVRTRCTLTAGDDPTEYGVSVTITAVEGGTARFDVQVDEQPLD